MTGQDDSESTVRSLKRTRAIVASDGAVRESINVHCPVEGRASSLEHCLKCTRVQRHVAVDGQGYLECRVPRTPTPRPTTCGELLSPYSTGLDSELDAIVAADLLEQARVSAAPVVDDNQVLIGMVSSSALAQLRLEQTEFHGFGRHVQSEVEDAMTTELITVREQTSVADAAAAMSRHDVDQLPVVTDDGHLVGVISALDIVRWLSRRLEGAP